MIYIWHKHCYDTFGAAMMARNVEQAAIMARAERRGMPLTEWLRIYAPKFPKVETIAA